MVSNNLLATCCGCIVYCLELWCRLCCIGSQGKIQHAWAKTAQLPNIAHLQHLKGVQYGNKSSLFTFPKYNVSLLTVKINGFSVQFYLMIS